MTGRVFSFEIPVRPKAVQSTRFTGKFCYVDPKTREWKNKLAPWIRLQKPPVPSKMPFEVIEAVYTFKLPASLPKRKRKILLEAIERGEDIPYLQAPDLDSNINKGICDVLTAEGIWEDDRQLWRVAENAVIKKVYGLRDGIKITIRETPDVLLENGVRAGEELDG